MDVIALVMDFLSKNFDEAKHSRDRRGRFSRSSGAKQGKTYTEVNTNTPDDIAGEIGDHISAEGFSGEVVARLTSYGQSLPVMLVHKIDGDKFPSRKGRAFLYFPKTGEVFYCPKAQTHESISDALKRDNMASVHFGIFSSSKSSGPVEIDVSSEYAGMHQFSMDSKLDLDEYESRALDNIYSGLGRLSELGLASNTEVNIKFESAARKKPSIKTTLGMSKSTVSFDEAKHPRDRRGRFASSRSASSAKEYEYDDMFSVGNTITMEGATGKVVGRVFSYEPDDDRPTSDTGYPIIRVEKFDGARFVSPYMSGRYYRTLLYNPKDGAVYVNFAPNDPGHEAMSEALGQRNLDFVHFYVSGSKIKVDAEYGGLGTFSFSSAMPLDEFESRSLDNIYAGAERLVKLGLPSETKLFVHHFMTNKDKPLETTLGKSLLAKYGTSEGALRGWVKRRGALGTYQQATEAKFRQKQFKRNTYGIPARYTAGRGAEIASQVDAARAAIRTSAAARSINSLVPLLGGYNSLRPGIKSMTLKKQVEIAIRGGEKS